MITASDIETCLYAAPEDVVLAVHDLTHAIMSDRWNQGVKPSDRKLRKARKTVDKASKASP